MADKVFPLKMESPAEGGTQTDAYPTEMNPVQDGIPVKELWVVADEADPSTQTIQQGVKTDAQKNLVLYDRNCGQRPLPALFGSDRPISTMTVDGLFTQGIVCGRPTSTATTLNGSLTLTVSSHTYQVLTGSAVGFSVVLPDARTLVASWHFEIVNTSTKTATVKDGSGVVLLTLDPGSVVNLSLANAATLAGTWVFFSFVSAASVQIINYTMVSNASFTTTSQTDAMITGFQVTPAQGRYGIWYNASSFYTTTPKGHWWSIYKNGAQIADSERRQDTAHSSQYLVDQTMTSEVFNGTDTLDVRVRCDNTGSLTVYGRTLLLSRMGST